MNVNLKTLAGRLGIAEYPEELDAAFDRMRDIPPIRGIARTLTRLHEKYAPFGEYYSFLLRGAEELERDEALLSYLSFGLAYCTEADEKGAAGFPLPPSDGSPAKDAFPALLIALEFPETVKRYRARGFDEAQIGKNLGNLGRNLYVNEITRGRTTLCGILYHWMTHYTKANIFDDNGFNFQPCKCGDEAILLRNRESGELAFLMMKGKFTANGTVAGARGAEDIPASFDAALEETEDAFIGYRAKGQCIDIVRERFGKDEWEAVMRPGDDFINFHIPRGADLTPSHVEKSVAQGRALAARYYPEYDFKCTVCTSWMLDPKLLDVLPEESKISQFIRRFLLRPTGDTEGVACMDYVWPGEKCSTEELPENTSLQRGIKKMMLDGKFIFWTTGVWLDC